MRIAPIALTVALCVASTMPVGAQAPNAQNTDGLFRSLSGIGNVAIGGGQEVTAWNTYQFSADGRVVRGAGVGGRTESPVTVTTQDIAPNRRGRYRVDGLMLTITYDDGSTERHIIITNPKDPKSAIWLDGVGYARRKS